MKKFLLLIVAVMMVLPLAACGQKKKTIELHDYTVLRELDPNKTVTITFWHSFSDTIANPLKGYVEDFMEKYPNIKVDLIKQEGGYSGLKDKVVKSIVSGDTPTLLIAYPDHIASYLTGNGVISLDKFINDEVVGLDTSDFIDSYMAENTQLGKTYGLPFNKSTEVFIYNKTYFEANNLPDPNELYDKGEWTWDKVVELAQQIKQLNPNRPASEKFYPFSNDSSANLFITLTRQWGGQYTNIQGELLFNNEQAIAAVDFYKQQHAAGLFTLPPEWELLYGTDKFLAQQLYMTVGSSAGVTKNVPLNGDFEIGVAPYPQKDPSKPYVIQQGTNLSIMADTTDEERLAAWLLIKYLTSAEVTLDLSTTTGYLPVRKSVLNGEAYTKFINEPDPEDPNAVAVAATAIAAKKQVHASFFDPAFNTSANVREEVGLALEAALFGGKTAREAIQAAYDELNIGW